jgi:hypothetical protein
MYFFSMEGRRHKINVEETCNRNRIFSKTSGANAKLELVMRVTKQMELLDISISGKPAGPTLERIKKTLATDKDGGLEVIFNEDGARWFKDELLVRMADKGQLYPDATINMACRLAGEKYYADWYGAGMGGLQAIDYGKVRSGQGGSGSHLPPGRMAAQCREAYRAARAAMPGHYRKPVELILLDGQSDLAAVGKAITGSATAVTCRAVAIERFTFGLYLLAKHYAIAK